MWIISVQEVKSTKTRKRSQQLVVSQHLKCTSKPHFKVYHLEKEKSYDFDHGESTQDEHTKGNRGTEGAGMVR